MSSMNIARHQAVINPFVHKDPIHIIGAGATGSRVFASLIELGFSNISVYDFDKVESHNLANQLFDYSDINTFKVTALDKWVNAKLGEGLDSLSFITERLPHPKILLGGTVFLLTDTMSSRREIYETCIKENVEINCVFETRMASSYGNIYSFNPLLEGEKWLNTLIDDAVAEVSSCGTSISVGATASIIANACVWQFMLSLTDPEAVDPIVDIFLKPFCMSTRQWPI